MPIDTSLLRPVPGPQLFDYQGLMGNIDKGIETRQNQAVGQAAAGGDYKAAARVAMEGGNVMLGGKLLDLNDAEHAKTMEEGARVLLAASSDPAAWNKLRAATAGTDHPLPAWEQRHAAVQAAMPLTQGMQYGQQRQAQANADRTFSLDQEKIRTGAGGQLGLTPIMGEGPNGETVILQPSNQGGPLRQANPPEGVRVLGIGDKAAATVVGKAKGGSLVDMPSVTASADRLKQGIDSVLNDPALGSATGPLGGIVPRAGQGFIGAADVQSKIDQVLGGTFLQAYKDLKGGGQITETEGTKATAALNRLQTQNMSTDQYKAALREFRQEVDNLVKVAEMKAAGGATQPPPNKPMPPSFGTAFGPRTATNPTTGERLVLDNGRWVPAR